MNPVDKHIFDRPVRIGMLGCGVVGSHVARLLLADKEELSTRAGVKIELVKIAVRTIRPIDDIDPKLFTTDAKSIVNDPEIDLIVEVMGGIEPARELIMAAIENRKSVVTANKALLASHGAEMFTAAYAKGEDIYYEAAVAGAIPIIRPMRDSLVGDFVTRLMGIVNGTTNYILTKMHEDNREFADVLKEAQALGYAEADPTADVDAHDARYKIAILASIGFGTPVDESSVISEGIRTITARDIAVAKDLDHVIKLVAVAEQWEEQGTMHVRVHPALLQKDHPLASVNGAYNAVLVRGDGVGDTMFYGRGAGSLPTGSAVVGDLIAVSRNLVSGSTGRVHRPANANLRMLPRELVTSKFYVRMTAKDLPKVLSQVSNVFGDFDVSIESVIQRANSKDEAEIVLITHRCLEENFRGAVDVAERLPVVTGVHNWIRVEA
jgi:homoserine dehydrogenase